MGGTAIVLAITLTGCAPHGYKLAVERAEGAAHQAVSEFPTTMNYELADADSGATAVSHLKSTLASNYANRRIIRRAKVTGKQVALSLVFYGVGSVNEATYNGYELVEICADYTGILGERDSATGVQVRCPDQPPAGAPDPEGVAEVLEPSP
jgi:hypothetical protein